MKQKLPKASKILFIISLVNCQDTVEKRCPFLHASVGFLVLLVVALISTLISLYKSGSKNITSESNDTNHLESKLNHTEKLYAMIKNIKKKLKQECDAQTQNRSIQDYKQVAGELQRAACKIESLMKTTPEEKLEILERAQALLIKVNEVVEKCHSFISNIKKTSLADSSKNSKSEIAHQKADQSFEIKENNISKPLSDDLNTGCEISSTIQPLSKENIDISSNNSTVVPETEINILEVNIEPNQEIIATDVDNQDDSLSKAQLLPPKISIGKRHETKKNIPDEQPETRILSDISEENDIPFIASEMAPKSINPIIDNASIALNEIISPNLEATKEAELPTISNIITEKDSETVPNAIEALRDAFKVQPEEAAKLNPLSNDSENSTISNLIDKNIKIRAGLDSGSSLSFQVINNDENNTPNSADDTN